MIFPVLQDLLFPAVFFRCCPAFSVNTSVFRVHRDGKLELDGSSCSTPSVSEEVDLNELLKFCVQALGKNYT